MEYNMPEIAKWFHGHYQPYIALGMRMGELALELLKARRHELKIVSETGTKPTYSCLTDGLQLATGCTIGNGRLKVEENAKLQAVFSKGDNYVKIQSKDFRFDLDFITNSQYEDLFSWDMK